MTDVKPAPSEPQTIPYERFKEVIDERNAWREAAMKGKQPDSFGGQNTQPKQEQPKEYTPSELQTMVEEGKLSQAAANETWQSQVERKSAATAAKAAEQVIYNNELVKRQSDILQKYKSAHPDAWNQTSEIFRRLQKRFNDLTALGHPGGIETEIAALELELGPPERVSGESKSFQTAAGEGYGDAQNIEGVSEALLKTMTPREKTYYQGLVNSGSYTWKQVEDELKYRKPGVAKKADMLYGRP